MKKIFAIIPALALTLAFPAFARVDQSSCCGNNRNDSKCCPTVTVNNNNTVHSTSVTASVANTGLNLVSDNSQSRSRKSSGSALVVTGNATAVTDSSTIAGSTGIFVTAPATGSVTVNNNSNTSSLGVTASIANSGANMVNGKGSIGTGAAGAQSSSFAFLGTNVVSVK